MQMGARKAKQGRLRALLDRSAGGGAKAARAESATGAAGASVARVLTPSMAGLAPALRGPRARLERLAPALLIPSTVGTSAAREVPRPRTPSGHPYVPYGWIMTTSYPDPARPTPVQTCTVMDFAQRLGLSRRGALDVFNAAAAHLDVVVRVGDSGRLTVTFTDFVRMVELAQTLESVGLTIRQLQRIQQSQDPNLWTLLQGRRVPTVAAPEAVDQPEVRVADAAVERIEAMLVDHLAQQRLMLDQHLSRPVPVQFIPAPVPTPAPARPRQGAPAPVRDVHPELPPQPLPVPVPARALTRVPTPAPALARVATPVSSLGDQPED